MAVKRTKYAKLRRLGQSAYVAETEGQPTCYTYILTGSLTAGEHRFSSKGTAAKMLWSRLSYWSRLIVRFEYSTLYAVPPRDLARHRKPKTDMRTLRLNKAMAYR